MRSGKVTPETLFDLTRDTVMEEVVTRSEEGVEVRSPVIVLRGATLSLGPGDELLLDGRHGAFVLSFGDLVAEGAAITATGSGPDVFRPFVAIAASGRVVMRGSRLTGLGFEGATAMAGLSIATGGIFQPRGASELTGNTFTDLHGVTVRGADGLHIDENSFVDSRGVALSLKTTNRVRVVRNLFDGGRGSHALRLAGPSRDVTIRSNAIVSAREHGVRIDDSAMAVVLRDNVISASSGKGLELAQGAACVAVAGNLIRDNGGDGIAASEVGSLIIAGNAVTGNGGAGISLARQLDGTTALIADNALARNRSGIRTASTTRLHLAGNDLSAQLPRIVAGELAPHTPRLLRQARKEAGAHLMVENVAIRSVPTLPSDGVLRAVAACKESGSD
ncbi:right-handed parallel beta-helix repeat-containing protein [Roseibium salinum]|uniref:right-handed parallel beta-helix repeat-containing protein n=1 Tax=Roseibium salinum TaxID=1604349 RepID=UPI0036111A02